METTNFDAAEETGELDVCLFGKENKKKKKETVVRKSDTKVVRSNYLKLLHESTCERFGAVYFCRDKARGGQTFKYIISDGRLLQVQCSCCSFEKELVVNTDTCLNKLNLESDVVDEDPNNFLQLHLHYSKFCGEQKKMVVFASSESDDIVPMVFDPYAETFTPSTCKCGSTCLKKFPSRESLEFGAQQMNFARYHLNKLGRPILCLSIDWYDKDHGLMNVFGDEKGRIGRYRFDPEIKRFVLVQPLRVRTCPMPLPQGMKSEKVIFDDELNLQYVSLCPTLRARIYFASYKGEMCTFLFNQTYMQFELIECEDCKFDVKNVWPQVPGKKLLSMHSTPSTQTLISLTRLETGKIVKSLTIGKKVVQIRPSPVRYLKHETLEKIRQRRHAEMQLHYELASILCDDDGTEYYSLGKDLMVDLTGRVTLFDPVPSNQSTVFKPKTLMDSDLEPKNVGACMHRNIEYFSALDPHTRLLNNYIFDVVKEEVQQVHCCPVGLVDFVRERTMIVAIGGAKPIYLRADKHGKLEKRIDRKLVVLAPKPVRQTFKWEKFDGKLSEPKPEDAIQLATPRDVGRGSKVKEVKAKDVKAKDVKAKDVKEVNVKEVKVKEVKVKEVNVKEVKVKEVNVREANVKEVKAKEVKATEVKTKAKKVNDKKVKDNEVNGKEVKAKEVKTKDVKTKATEVNINAPPVEDVLEQEEEMWVEIEQRFADLQIIVDDFLKNKPVGALAKN